MTKNRQGFAALLLSVLVLGGTVAPLSHFGYMAASDLFAAEHASEVAAGHHGSAMQHAPEASTLAAAHAEHELCEYASLFATAAAAADLSQQSDIVANSCDASVPFTLETQLSSSGPLSEAVRGPPAEGHILPA